MIFSPLRVSTFKLQILFMVFLKIICHQNCLQGIILLEKADGMQVSDKASVSSKEAGFPSLLCFPMSCLHTFL